MTIDLDQVRKSLPIFNVRNKLISEIQRNPTLILLGRLKLNRQLIIENKKKQ